MDSITIYYLKNKSQDEYFDWVLGEITKQQISPKDVVIQVQPYDLIFLRENAEEIVRISFENILKANPLDFDNSGHAKSEIYNLLIRMISKYFEYYVDENLISFLADVFYMTLTKHYLNNGNKRIATSLLFTLLGTFNMSLQADSRNLLDIEQESRLFEEAIVDFVIQHVNREDVHQNICQWLKSKVTFLVKRDWIFW